MSYEWDNKKPTAQMLGRWQPFHDGHYALFEKIIKKTGQVSIQVKDVHGVGDNPFNFSQIKKNIEERLLPKYKNRFEIILVPNISNICYGRTVGYKIEENICDNNPVQEHFNLGNSLGVSGTPSIITSEGRMIPGYVPPEELVGLLES